MSRRLVVTADDLGLGPRTNEAIVDLARQGRITSTTLMPVAPGARDAARRVRAASLPDPRLHVTLTSARELTPWRPLAGDVGSLTDAGGSFHVLPARVHGSAEPDHLRTEMRAQLAWMHAEGLRPQALDSHSGSLYGRRGMDSALRFCAEHSLGFRLPRRLPRLARAGMRGRLRRRYDQAVATAHDLGLRLPETLVGAWLPGRLLVSYAHLRAHVLGQLRAIPDGVSELILHPAPASAGRLLHPAEGRKRAWELRLLRDPEFRAVLRRERIGLVPAW
ncbi:ChbG/HpnK family deacetylase [Georgenia alba]|uniref:ChbG/HpnK family deacetylase n=1 Tax=Georgenia alba TaxID=2233858 RepID=A0ABW2QCF4_9MICO